MLRKTKEERTCLPWAAGKTSSKRGLGFSGSAWESVSPVLSQMLQFLNKVVSIFPQDISKYSGRFFSQALPVVKLIITNLLAQFQMRLTVDGSIDRLARGRAGVRWLLRTCGNQRETGLVRCCKGTAKPPSGQNGLQG